MGRLRIAAIECNYKETDRQLKEQFIHWLNDDDRENKELTRTKENENVTNKQNLVWARSVEAQKAHSAIVRTLNETKDFDKISTRGKVQMQIEVQL